ncbi:MAG: UDP-glucose/GDP-mannose dehydrogenase family protein [Parcubacteria group bacterium]|nr:UDP-glucose/GDP-mannose dehydrogenase family protein [Parcubacteria group bacterium]
MFGEMQNKNYKIGIMGTGMVGGSLSRYFSSKDREHILYDPPKNQGSREKINSADIIFICVPTPYIEQKGFDLSFVEGALDVLDDGKVVIIKSTILPGTTDKIQEKYPNLKVLFNPEFLTEVTADQDMNYPDRQIVGYTEKSHNVALDVMQLLPLAPFERVVPARVAEMVKYYGNTWFSTKVVFANQIYDLCQKLDTDYDSVKECVAPDKRIGRSHLDIFHKGFRGYGGKCLPKDTRALIQIGDELGASMELLKKVEELNNKLVSERKEE